MRGLTTADIVAVWERAGAEPALTRPAALLGTPDSGDLALGERDGALLDLYAATFGDRLDAVATCPSCATAVELSLSCAELRRTPKSPVEPLKVDGQAVEWRLPTTKDLEAVAECFDAAEAGAQLLRRCVIVADELTSEVREAVGAAMAAADPLAEILLDLDCPQCNARWSSQLDVAAFVWRHLDAAAQRLFVEVHTLARAYGWTEPQILALSPTRRATYLRLVGNG